MPGGVTIPITIQVFKGQTLARTETLSQDVIKIGKLSSSHLQLDDESVSRMHAVLEVSQNGEVSVVDLGSTKGTFVNGGRTSRSRVNSGDEVRIGDIRLIVTFSSASQGDSTQQASAADMPRTTGPRPTTMGVTALSPPPTITAPPIPPGPPSVPGIPPVSSPGIAPQSSAMGVIPPSPFGGAVPPPASVPSPFGHHAAPAVPMQAAPAQVPAHRARYPQVQTLALRLCPADLGLVGLRHRGGCAARPRP